jgi:hypothetical protein
MKHPDRPAARGVNQNCLASAAKPSAIFAMYTPAAFV